LRRNTATRMSTGITEPSSVEQVFEP
jgi:hypothetical protein